MWVYADVRAESVDSVLQRHNRLIQILISLTELLFLPDAGHLVVAGRGGDEALATEGVEVGVVEDGAGGVGDDAGSAEVVGEVVENVVLVIAPGDAPATEKNALGETGILGLVGEIGFVERLAARAVPVELSVGFLDALAIAVILVGDEIERLKLLVAELRQMQFRHKAKRNRSGKLSGKRVIPGYRSSDQAHREVVTGTSQA